MSNGSLAKAEKRISTRRGMSSLLAAERLRGMMETATHETNEGGL